MIENQINYDITNIEKVKINTNIYKSKMVIGNNLYAYNKKHFNKLQKVMWKLLLGIEIIDINEEF